MSMQDLREALAASGVGPLIAKQIDLNLLEYMRRYSPLVAAIPTEEWSTNQYFFNTRSARPSGGFVQDGGARPVATSTYSQSSFNIRNLQTVGSVTGFAQAVTRGVIGDLKSREVDGAIQNMLWDIETAVLWGHEPATYNTGSGTLGPYPEFTGLAWQVNSFSGASQNATDSAGGTLTLAYLDEMKDLVEEQAAMPVEGEQWMFVMSPRAKTKIDQLLVNQQRFVDKVEVAAGLIVGSYAGIPIVKSSFLSPRSNQMGTPSIAQSQSASNPTGSLPNAARFYKISAVQQRFGEIAASAEITVTVGAGGQGIVTISSIVAPAGPDGAAPLLYLVYESATTGTEVLLGVVDAFDTTGAATTTIIDTGTALLTNSVANSVNPTAYVGAPATGTLGARAALQEDIYLIPRDSDFLLRPVVRDITPINLAPTITAPDTLPFALVTDTCLATRGPKYLGRLARVVAGI